MSKITANIQSVLECASTSRLITLVDGQNIGSITRDQALTIAKRDDYHLIVRGGHVRKMIRVEAPPPVWQRCFRTAEAAVFPPWPGFAT